MGVGGCSVSAEYVPSLGIQPYARQDIAGLQYLRALDCTLCPRK